MTYAPDTIQAARRLLLAELGLDANEVGIVGDTAHAAKGTSYHLGRDQLVADAYSARTARDKAGLSDAASALDLGSWAKGAYNLRHFTGWLFAQCRASAPDTLDLREVIGTTDGRTVLRWDAERGRSSAPRTGEADSSHLYHTHLSWYRDSEHRDKTGLFRRYLIEIGLEEDMADYGRFPVPALVDGRTPDLMTAEAWTILHMGCGLYGTKSARGGLLARLDRIEDALIRLEARPTADVDEAALAELLAPHLPEGADPAAIATAVAAKLGAALTAAAPEAGAAS